MKTRFQKVVQARCRYLFDFKVVSETFENWFSVTRTVALPFIALLLPVFISAQKTAYIPNYLLDTNTVDGKQFSWDKTAQSENFTIIWGDAAGIDPTQAPEVDLRFNPATILDTMEWIYTQFVEYGFAWDTAGTNLSEFKIPVIMLNTFGPTGVTGWAFGGDPDGIIGTFWAHPLAMQSGHVAAHELVHSLQAQANIDYRNMHGLGPVWLNAGIFWETHANFMRNLLYPQDVSAWGMDHYHIETWGDWKNTYENYAMLFAIMEMDGIGIINRMWRESYSDEYPLQAYKRLMGYTQDEFNAKMYDYAKRMATYDFPVVNVGSYFRTYRALDLMNWLSSVQSTWTILEQDSVESNHYRVPVHLAPEEFAYNVIPIHPDDDSCAVLVKFKGQTDVNVHAGWRYGFVAADAEGIVTRYSDMYAETEDEIAFSLEAGEAFMYFVVIGAPDMITTNVTNDTWHGYPKHFRFPYELNIRGGVPEGFQQPELFRAAQKFNGHPHPNGGGWVSNDANVDASVYVGLHAIVHGSSVITGDVKILNTAMIVQSMISGTVEIRDNALVLNSQLSDNAVVAGQAFIENTTMWDSAIVHMRARVSNYKLHGDIEVGGDVIVYNATGDCDNGVYYRMTNYYQDNLLECDGRTAEHPVNADVNNVIVPFSNAGLMSDCNCANYPACLTVGVKERPLRTAPVIVYPNPASDMVFIKGLQSMRAGRISLYNELGQILLELSTVFDESHGLDVSHLSQGLYVVKVENETQGHLARILLQ